MDEGVFKTSLMGGFKKEDVLSFIDNLDSQYKSERENLEKNIDEFKETIRQKNTEISNVEKQKSDIINELEQSKVEYKELSELNQINADEAEKLRIGLEQKNFEIDSLRHELFLVQQSLKESNEKFEQRDVIISEREDKIKELENRICETSKTEDQIARVLLEAHSTADNIIDKAQNLSDELLNSTYSKIKTISSNVDNFEHEISNMRTEAKGFFETVDSMIASLEDSAKDINTSYLKGYDDMIKPDVDNVNTSEETLENNQVLVNPEVADDNVKQDDSRNSKFNFSRFFDGN